MRKAEVFVKGPGAGRESAIRTVQNTGIEVTTIRDITPLPITLPPSETSARLSIGKVDCNHLAS
jgi:ribosomal protein S11